MQAVGRLGSYISKSVYTVSGPFHPFGGAVDIIVVKQPDGSYKSSPWYVKFGKFQGVLKTKEKVVSISVNGVEADFHMYLSHKGEAYFLKEVDDEEDLESVFSPPSSSGDDTDGSRRRPTKSKSCNYDSNWSESIAQERKTVTRANSRRSQIFGLVFGKKSMKEEGIIQEGENETGVIRTESLERAEIAADLLDLKWSTNLFSSRRKKDCNSSRFSGVDVSKDEVGEDIRENIEEDGVEVKCLTENYVVETGTSVKSVEENTTLITDESGLAKSDFHVSSVSVISEVAKSDDSHIQDSVEKLNGDQFTFFHEERISISGGNMNGDSESLVAEYSRLVTLHQSNDPLKDIDSQTIAATSSSDYSTCSSPEKQTVLGEDEVKKNGFSERSPRDPHISIFDILEPKISEEEQLLFGDMDDFGSSDDEQLDFSRVDDEGKEADCSFSSKVDYAKCCSAIPLDQSVINDYMNDVDPHGRKLKSVSSDSCIEKTCRIHSKELTRMARSLPFMGPLSDNLEASDKHHRSPGARAMFEDDKILESKVGRANASIETPPRPVDSLRGSQRSWPFPFKKSRSMKVSHVETNGVENPNAVEILNNSSDVEGGKNVTKVKVNKKKVLRILTPTSEQLASLNLKEGKNIVVFTFQTAMLGKQQVDARIFMWRWDTRIVISDVDGTITRSDLLGQVMPLVGMDWSQTGVAHLFSAIKENGYQLIFLSARSIAQSFLTRQFLFNIKQDGKALPDGPVVISPDGLFPSLFREVVRRAPHEFKIACLEDIKALFPAGTNPFYAGFGNRDTDEFSYLKVGIPRGKIFIINPKGEIVVNRRVDTKSYLSLHALVHGMFPSMSSSSSEQEDFNTWNYWKLPPPIIDL